MSDQLNPGPVPKEALAYFRHKSLKPSFDYRDVWREEHAYAFTVAKAAQLDVLTTIQGELDTAIASGRTFQQFKADLRPKLEAQGWWGRKEMTDPVTGETREVQLGSPRRLKTIYTANLRTARAAGQWERIERTKAALPYLLYVLGPSREHRPEHAGWAGTLLPVDDPWWNAHNPPTDYGCKCRIRQVSGPEAERIKRDGVPDQTAPQEIDPETGLPTGHREKRLAPVKTEAPPDKLVPWLNKRTGHTEMVPKGIAPGWDHNPGKARWAAAEGLLGGKVMTLPKEYRATVLRDLAARGADLQASFGAWVDELMASADEAGHIRTTGRLMPVGHLSAAVVEGLVDLGVAPETTAIAMTDKDLLHLMHLEGRRKAERIVPLEMARRIPELIASAQAVLYDTEDPALLYIFDPAAQQSKGKLVVRVNFKLKSGDVVNSVRTGQITPIRNLDQPRYKLLDGQL